jgi:hypothetical protein
MGQMIVKAARDRDLYLVWSSVVDAPIAVGTRSEMATYAGREWRYDVDEAEAVLRRVEERGSSDRSTRAGWWDDDALTVMEGSPADGWYRIRRDRLADYAEALMRDDEGAAQALLECWHRIGDDD